MIDASATVMTSDDGFLPGDTEEGMYFFPFFVRVVVLPLSNIDQNLPLRSKKY